MTRAEFLAAVADDELMKWTLLIGSVITLILLGRWVRKTWKSDRPDETLSNLAMIIGLGWSSEAIWELTGRMEGFPTGVRIALFCVFETLLVLAMIRAKRAMVEFQDPGRSGRTAWIIASVMAVVAFAVGDTFAERMMRLAIPLLVTNAWWDGLVGDGPRKKRGATTLRITPRRIALWIGLIEPGERDVDTVHRERLIQQMTKLAFRRTSGPKWLKKRREGRLSRLSLVADDDVIGAVQANLRRADWFKAPADVKQQDTRTADPAAGVPAREAASRKSRRVLHRRSLRTLRIAHVRPVASAGQEPDPDTRTKQEIDDAIRFIKAANPRLTQRQIAAMVRTSDTRVHRVLRSNKPAVGEAAQPEINGREPDLEGVR
jgi:hypothetical protein